MPQRGLSAIAEHLVYKVVDLFLDFYAHSFWFTLEQLSVSNLLKKQLIQSYLVSSHVLLQSLDS